MSQAYFAYDTPLVLPEGVSLNPVVIEINGMKFQARSDCEYYFDYYKIVEAAVRAEAAPVEWKRQNPLINPLNIYRNLLQEDLWAFVYFVMKNPLANHPFIVNACREVQEERGDTLEVWARDHLKTTVISVGKTCQDILNDPCITVAIFSATRPLALRIQNQIRNLLEDGFIKKCFPDVVYEDPWKEAEKWSESVEGGLIVKRDAPGLKEPTVSSFGLIEGMPTGGHYRKRLYDDIVTQDLLAPDVSQRIKDNFDISENVGTQDGQATVVGTFYDHQDALVYISEKKDPVTGVPLFKMRKKPATENGELNGKSVFQPERVLAKKRANNLYFFKTQQLLNPSARGTEKFNREHLVVISKDECPKRLYKFMVMDGAGDSGKRNDNRVADAWAMGVIGVEPYRDDHGASNIVILDLIIEPMDLVEAMEAGTQMYMRGGRILKLGVEKVAMSTTEIHMASALRAKGRYLSTEIGNLEILKPAGRSKEYRIESALSWPFRNSKIKILDTVGEGYIERLKTEMEKFPYWKDDGLDILSYVYDMIKGYRFPIFVPEKESEGDAYERRTRKRTESNRANGWMVA